MCLGCFLNVVLRGWYPPWNTSAPPPRMHTQTLIFLGSVMHSNPHAPHTCSVLYHTWLIHLLPFVTDLNIHKSILELKKDVGINNHNRLLHMTAYQLFTRLVGQKLDSQILNLLCLFHECHLCIRQRKPWTPPPQGSTQIRHRDDVESWGVYFQGLVNLDLINFLTMWIFTLREFRPGESWTNAVYIWVKACWTQKVIVPKMFC